MLGGGGGWQGWLFLVCALGAARNAAHLSHLLFSRVRGEGVAVGRVGSSRIVDLGAARNAAHRYPVRCSAEFLKSLQLSCSPTIPPSLLSIALASELCSFICMCQRLVLLQWHKVQAWLALHAKPTYVQTFQA